MSRLGGRWNLDITSFHSPGLEGLFVVCSVEEMRNSVLKYHYITMLEREHQEPIGAFWLPRFNSVVSEKLSPFNRIQKMIYHDTNKNPTTLAARRTAN